MEKIVRGIHHFQTTAFSAHRELFEILSQGQQPDTLLIACSDSRIAPDLLMQTQPGDLFVLRNAGNLIPPYGAANGGEGATIEYAVSALGVKHALVMGHSNCGAMKGLLDPESLVDICRWSGNGLNMPTRRGMSWTNVIPTWKASICSMRRSRRTCWSNSTTCARIRRSRRLWRKAR